MIDWDFAMEIFTIQLLGATHDSGNPQQKILGTQLMMIIDQRCGTTSWYATYYTMCHEQRDEFKPPEIGLDYGKNHDQTWGDESLS